MEKKRNELKNLINKEVKNEQDEKKIKELK